VELDSNITNLTFQPNPTKPRRTKKSQENIPQADQSLFYSSKKQLLQKPQQKQA
jgi:hypothetical protein